MSQADLHQSIASFLQKRVAEFEEIPEERKQLLEQLGKYIREKRAASVPTQLTFLCTHNSRRSHLSQIWAKVAADHYGLNEVSTFSGGTEATAMNERVVASLCRTGFKINPSGDTDNNPIYLVTYAGNRSPLECFSKVYDQKPNPKENFAAVMTCSSADQACPVVPGCDARLPIRYEDPKISDDTEREAEIYDERSRQICREMLYAMSRV